MVQGEIYHVYNRGISDNQIFRNEQNYAFFLRRLKKYLANHADILAYCLMPTHFHLMIQVTELGALPSRVQKSKEEAYTNIELAFKNFLVSYVKAFNRQHGRHGALFQEKYKRKKVLLGRQLENTLAYIHLNPVVAGYRRKLKAWPYSSFQAYLEEDYALIDPALILSWFSNLDEFVDFHLVYAKRKAL